MKHTLKHLAKRTPLYPLYRWFVDRQQLRERQRRFWDWSAEDQRRFDFYRKFIREGDIAFDVGANMGNRAKIFSRLGATVVAVEPQSRCADFLSTVFRHTGNFHLVRKALGPAVGRAEMLISDAHTISSLAPDWVRAVKESRRFEGLEWDKREVVDIETLDNLIARYGKPSFVKIDVEGFEDGVLSGLSTPVAALSFEFTPEFSASTHRCIKHLQRIAGVQFQISLGESMEFLLPDWVTADEIGSKLLTKCDQRAFGDLYARFDA